MRDSVPRVALRGDSRSELHPEPQLRFNGSEGRPPFPVRRVPPKDHGFRDLTLYSRADFREVPASRNHAPNPIHHGTERLRVMNPGERRVRREAEPGVFLMHPMREDRGHPGPEVPGSRAFNPGSHGIPVNPRPHSHPDRLEFEFSNDG